MMSGTGKFAHKYDLPIKQVVAREGEEYSLEKWQEWYHEDGILVNSGEFNGQTSEELVKILQLLLMNAVLVRVK